MYFIKQKKDKKITKCIELFILKSDCNKNILNMLLKGKTLQEIANTKGINSSRQAISQKLVSLYKSIYMSSKSVEIIIDKMIKEIDQEKGFAKLKDYFDKKYLLLSVKLLNYYLNDFKITNGLYLTRKKSCPRTIRIKIYREIKKSLINQNIITVDELFQKSKEFFPKETQFTKKLFISYISESFTEIDLIIRDNLIITHTSSINKIINYLLFSHKGDLSEVFKIIQKDYSKLAKLNGINSTNSLNNHILVTPSSFNNAVLYSRGRYETQYESFKNINDEEMEQIIKNSLDATNNIIYSTDTNYIMKVLEKKIPKITKKINAYLLKHILVNSGLFKKGAKLSLIQTKKGNKFISLYEIIYKIIKKSHKKNIGLSVKEISRNVNKNRIIHESQIYNELNKSFKKRKDGTYILK